MNKPTMPISCSKKLLLTFSIFIGLSILYQVYFFEFNNGILVGGESQRFFLKVVFTALFTLSVRDYLSWKALFRNLPYKLPILYVVFSICLLAPFLESAYLQALNIVFFLPILFLDWNKDGGEKLFKSIWVIIAAITILQLVLDPILKFYFNVFWDNRALIGGMGNPNVFGFFLIVSGLVCEFLIISKFRHISKFLFFSTVMTGSVASLIIGLFFILISIRNNLRKSLIGYLAFFGALLFVFYIFIFDEYIIDEIVPVRHAIDKLISIVDFSLNNISSGPSSLSIRMEYLNDGLVLIEKSPLSLFFGHPDFLPMYNGDGLWTSFLVSYGVPLTLCFLVVNLLLFYRGISLRNQELRFSSAVIFVSMCFFSTNRILDYWPAAFLYILAFTYLTNKSAVCRKSVSQVM